MKISLITECSQLETQDTLISQVIHLLRGWGVIVKQIVPESCCFNLAHIQLTSDLYLLTSGTPLALSMAGILHALGAPLINPYPVVNAIHNKLMGLRLLHAHGLPIPETYVVTNLDQIKALLAAGPLIVHQQSSAALDGEVQSERLVSHLGDIHTAITPQNPLVVQRYFEPFGRYWMVYCIGGQLLSIERRQPAAESWTQSLPGRDRAVAAPDDATMHRTAELHELALRCGQVFDIDLFGIKAVAYKGTIYVVDMMSFPDFTDTPEAAPRLAEYLYARAQFLMEKKRENQGAGRLVV